VKLEYVSGIPSDDGNSYKRIFGFNEILENSLSDESELYEAVVGLEFPSDCLAVDGGFTVQILVFGFSVLMFSSFMPVFYFGFLVASVMVSTTLGALLVLPTVIYYFKLPIDKELDWKIFEKLNIKKMFASSTEWNGKRTE
jgi:hypothetical protein